MKKWTLALAAVALVGVVAASQAARGDVDGNRLGLHDRLRHWIHGGAHADPNADAHVVQHLDAMVQRLELSAEQRKEIAARITAARGELETRAIALVDAHAAEFALVHAPELDETALRAAAVRAGAAQGEFAVAIARLMRDVHGSLSPEQRARLPHFEPLELVGFAKEHIQDVGRALQRWAELQ